MISRVAGVSGLITGHVSAEQIVRTGRSRMISRVAGVSGLITGHVSAEQDRPDRSWPNDQSCRRCQLASYRSRQRRTARLDRSWPNDQLCRRCQWPHYRSRQSRTARLDIRWLRYRLNHMHQFPHYKTLQRRRNVRAFYSSGRGRHSPVSLVTRL